MRRLFLLLILFSALSHASANFTYLDPSFNKPWEPVLLIDQNLAVSLIMNEFDDDADLSISYMNDFDAETTRELRDAISRARDADELYFDVKNAKNEMIAKSINIFGVGTIAGGAVLVSALVAQWEIAIVVVSGGAAYVTSEGLELINIIKEYYSGLVDSVQKSEESYNILLSKINQEYAELDRMGITAESYRGQSYNDISWVKTSLSNINSERLVEREQTLKSLLSTYSTSTSVYDRIISNSKAQIFDMLDGRESAFYTLVQIYLREKKIQNDVLEERASLRSSVSSKYSDLENQLNEVRQDYGEFVDSDIVYFRISSIQTIDAPYDHIKDAEVSLKRAENNIRDGDSAYNSGSEGYVARSIMMYYDAADNLDSAYFEINRARQLGEFMLSSAESATELEYASALSDADSFIPTTEAESEQLNSARALLDDAEQLLNKRARTKRERFNNLKLAYKNSVLARSYLSSTAAFYSNAKSDALYKLEYLKKVIDLASSDGIEVDYERSFHSSSKIQVESGNLPASQMINISLKCTELAERIYVRAGAQYSNLGVRFSEIKPYMQYLAELDGEYPKEYLSLKPYLNADDSINIRKALGHYSELSSMVNSLYSQVHMRSKSLIMQSLKTNSRVFVAYSNSSVCLDKPVKKRVEFSTHSSLDLIYAGPLTITIPFKHDITDSAEVANPWEMDYSYSSGKLTVLIPEYEKNAQYIIQWEDYETLARTISEEQEVLQTSPNEVVVSLTNNIKSSGVPRLLVQPRFSGYAYSLYLDGIFVGSHIGEATINREIAPGRHVILQKYVMRNPFRASFDEVSESTFSGRVSNLLPIDVPEAYVKINLPILNPSSVTASSLDCTILKQEYAAFPDSTELFIQFSSLPAESSCSITIYSSSAIDPESVQEIIDELRNDSGIDSSVEERIDEAQRYLDAGDADSAYEAANEAKIMLEEKSEQRRRESAINSTLSAYNKTIRLRISDLISVNDKQVHDIVSKAKMYYDASAHEIDSSKKLSNLRKADRELAKIDSLVYDRLSSYSEQANDLKQRWLYLIDKGYADELPADISLIEQQLSSISFSGDADSSLFDRLNAISSNLSTLESKTSLAEKDEKRWESSLKSSYKSAISKLKAHISKLSDACSTSCPENLVAHANSLLTLNPSSPSEYKDAISYINDTISNIATYVRTEQESANDAIGELRKLISAITDYGEKQTLVKKLHNIESLYDKGKYYSAKQSALTLASAISSSQGSDQNDYTLIFAGIAVILLSFIILKMKERNTGVQEEIKKILKKGQ